MQEIQAIIGLGNPGNQRVHNRHNIGFRVVEAIADRSSVQWHTKDNLLYSTIDHDGREILLIKPQTYMNDSGKFLSWLKKKGIDPAHILVVHDELELPFGTIKYKFGGSH